MTGLPRKYAKMGFKRGWKAYRSSKSTRSSARKVKSMARRKRSRSRFSAFTRSVGRKVRRSYKRQGAAFDVALLGSAAAYGAFRQDVQQRIVAPIAAKLPLGGLTQYADNALALGGGYLLSKKTTGLPQKAGRAIMIVEAAQLGAKLRANGFAGMVSTTASSTGGATF